MLNEDGHKDTLGYFWYSYTWGTSSNWKGRPLWSYASYIELSNSPHCKYKGDIVTGTNVLFADQHVKWQVQGVAPPPTGVLRGY